jgi:hypothetical protein
MIHDEVNINLNGYAHFVFDNKILHDSDTQTLKELKDSFLEFQKAGVSVLPFDKMTISTAAIRGNNELPGIDILYIITKTDDVTEISMYSRGKPYKPAHIFTIKLTCGSPTEYKKSDPVTMEQLASFSCACMAIIMIINSHEVIRDEVIISEKLNKARAKTGKPLLNNYIVIRLSEEARRKLTQSEDGTITFRKPHWRRGHLRRLPTGRVVPVHACIVNWNGEPVEPKRYVVKP